MARYKNGINGPVSGKIGNVVAASYKGIDYVRSKPAPSSKAPTAAQLKQRRLFTMVNNWLKPIRDLINIGFQALNDSRTPMNLALSFTLKEAVTDGVIDFSKAVFSRGTLCISFIKEVLFLVEAVLYLKWEDGSLSAFCEPDDRATFIIYNPVKAQFVIFDEAASRSDNEVMLQLPVGFKHDQVHCWMQYVNLKGDQVSTTSYIGMIAVG